MTHSLDRILAQGAMLHDSGRYHEALALYDQYAQIFQNSEYFWNNRANTLLELGLHQQASESYRHALLLAPGLDVARVALASCLQSLGEYQEALVECETVLAHSPNNAEAHWNRSLLLLLDGHYREGWLEYEWRWKKQRFTSPRREYPQPLWSGEEIHGKTLLIHAEQGLGDTIQFCRYLPLLVQRGASIIFECHTPLTGLMRTLGNGITPVPFGSPLPRFDLHLPLLSLPLILNTTLATIPASIPYLKPPSDKTAFWRSIIPCDRQKKIGICWAGKTYPDPGRSCPPELLNGLTSQTAAGWYSLQADSALPAPHGIIDLSSQLLDFSDTAAMLVMLDLIVTIDTSVAHLAGALGKDTLLMLPFSADWRWLTGRRDSPWYPTMKIFRQPSAGDWPAVIADIGNHLQSSGIT